MRIGLNLLYLIPGVVGGTETYARGLIGGLKHIRPDHEFYLFINRESEKLFEDAPGFRKVVCPIHAQNRMRRYFFEQLSLPGEADRKGIDLLHSLAYTSPLFLSCPSTVTIPDLNFRAFGDTMPLVRRLTLAWMVRQAVCRADRVITISEFSRKEILSHYHASPEKVAVTHLAAGRSDDEAGQAGDELPCAGVALHPPRPYAVAFSSVTANKNLPRLVKAFGEAKKKYRFPHHLVLIGHKYPADESGLAEETSGDIIRTGYLKECDAARILRQADFLVFPSYYEGFGLPLLEAMAAGVPVVCSSAASLPEVAGDAGIFFDPFSERDMAEKIAQVASGDALKADLRQKGFLNLERFSWQKTAMQTVAVYDGILQNKQESAKQLKLFRHKG